MLLFCYFRTKYEAIRRLKEGGTKVSPSAAFNYQQYVLVFRVCYVLIFLYHKPATWPGSLNQIDENDKEQHFQSSRVYVHLPFLRLIIEM